MCAKHYLQNGWPQANDIVRNKHQEQAPGDRPVDGAENIAISIISRSRLLRDGLMSLIQPYLPVTLAGSYTGDPEPELRAPDARLHVVLIDASIGEETAKCWTRWWREHSAKVLILEVDDDKDVILACIETGANGYTIKETSPAEVARAIEQASQGQAVCSPEITAYVFARLAALKSAIRLPAASLVPLTTRELEVLHYIAEGLSNKEIATLLMIEIHTVKHHVHNILDKLSISNRRDAARFAMERGWLNTPYIKVRPVD